MENTNNSDKKLCACGCNTLIPKVDKYGVERFYALNHHRKNKPSPNFKGGQYVDTDGYTRIYRPHHKHANKRGYVVRSRYWMELELGRYLDPKEVIHHIIPVLEGGSDEPENLKLYSNHGEHIAKEHNPKQDFSDRFCLKCGSNATSTQTKKNGKKYVKWLRYENGFLCLKCYDKLRWVKNK